MAEKKRQQPLLTIGMIFKNEIRCLERCLKSLQPLREAIPCELVMADTGADDGSRQVAEKYADILIDFPWINDFAAARNSVMEQASGEWYLTIDADEWLEDISELVRFLKKSSRRQGGANTPEKAANLAFPVQRNYFTYNMAIRDQYLDAFVPRMLRKSTGIRYAGAIHEYWKFTKPSPEARLPHTYLHHDGYAGMNVNDEAGRAKRERNLTLLREQLEKEPESLRTLSECVDVSQGEEQMNFARRMVKLVKEKKDVWQIYGPACMKTAVNAAVLSNKMDELDEWIALAEEMFPTSYAVRLDIAVSAFQRLWNKPEKDYAECIRRGEDFLAAYADYHAGRGDQSSTRTAYAVAMAAPLWKPYVQLFLAYAYFKHGEPERTWQLLDKLSFSCMDVPQTRFFTAAMKEIQRETDYDTTPVLLRFWEQINAPDFVRSEECRSAFETEAAQAFSPVYLANEQQDNERRDAVFRPAYSLFTPLQGKNQLGTAAALMEEQNPEELERLLRLVENWQTLPEVALSRALLAGAKFPVQSLKLAEMDGLAQRLSAVSLKSMAELVRRAKDEDFSAGLQRLLWVLGLALAAVRNWDWLKEGNFELAQTFAVIENTFLRQYYAPELLCAENIGLLPPLHAFGWHCAQAFLALENGDALGYVRLLRQGLEFCPKAKDMVKFLAKNTPKLQPEPAHSAELAALAEQIRTVLSNYPPNDPATAAIKASPAYQRVAHLIESNAL